MHFSGQPIRYAGFWRRSTAYGYDIILLQGAALLCMFTFYDFPTLEQIVMLDATADHWFSTFTNLYIALSGVYNVLLVASPKQATLGKMACGIIVVSEGGARLSFVQSAIRHVFSGVSMLAGGLGYITMFFSRQKTALHDILGRTRVIYKDPA